MKAEIQILILAAIGTAANMGKFGHSVGKNDTDPPVNAIVGLGIFIAIAFIAGKDLFFP